METKGDKMTVAAAALHATGQTDAGEKLAGEVAAQLGEKRADLCLLFATAHFDDELDKIVADVHDRLSPGAFVGTTGESVICNAVEYERRPAVTLWAAHLPAVRAATFHLSQEDLERLEEPAAWHDHLHLPAEQQPHFILLADPFSFNLLEMLERLEQAYPGRPAIGGVASAGEQPGQNHMIFEGQPLHHGLCGVALTGNIQIDTVVSQGCRPIGHHLVITEGERNVIRQLGGKPPLAVVIDTLKQCSTRDIELARSGGLLVGRVINEHQPRFTRGDFLIRNPIGFEQESGAMMINDLVRIGQTIQFHVRDSKSADDDLLSLLGARPRAAAAGALLFTCNGRGSRLFKERHHDARAVAQACDALPVAGMFCAGEIGPVSRRNFLHGHTASIAFFRPATSSSEV
ncbi:MAG: FIST C-terminal domain-containing protein [Planctomycetes bacterium]|nr:FIST C-terminal domain-containing protein [Planctomycetota bacterium]